MVSEKPLTGRAAREKNREAFKLFFSAYPKKTANAEAERTFTEIVENGVSPDLLIQKARAYARTVDPSNLKYVPAPHSWLKFGRYEDQDLFSNQAEQEREWLRECWRNCNIKAVENRYHVIYEKDYPPDDMTDPDAIALWYRETARAWITKVYEEMIACREQKQPTMSSQSSPLSVPSSTTPTHSQTLAV